VISAHTLLRFRLKASNVKALGLTAQMRQALSGNSSQDHKVNRLRLIRLFRIFRWLFRVFADHFCCRRIH
jgi:hypothetical protein